MAGQIINKGENKWLVRIYLGRDAEGRRKYANKQLNCTKKDAQAYLTKALRDRDLGVFVEPSKQTVGEYLDSYLQTAEARVRPRTHRSYSDLCRLYLKPNLGAVQLAKLTTEQIEKAYGELLGKGLSARTVRYSHALLNGSLRQAVRRGHLARNPAEFVSLPREEKREMQALGRREAARFLKAAREDRWAALWLLSLTTGMRPGEVLGLRWSDVDLETGTLSVQRTLVRKGGSGPWSLEEPKTPGSRRSVTLPAETVKGLQAHRAAQAAERLAAGPAYGNLGLVFADSNGQPPHYRNLVRRHFKPLLQRAGLPETVRLYDLRHSCATLLLAAGENPKIVAERLGHADVSMTLNTYSHVLPDMQRRAADKIQEVLFEQNP